MEYSFWKDGHQWAWIVMLIAGTVSLICCWKMKLGPYYDPKSRLSKGPDGNPLPRMHWSAWATTGIIVVGCFIIWCASRTMINHDKWERGRLQQARPAIVQQVNPPR